MGNKAYVNGWKYAQDGLIARDASIIKGGSVVADSPPLVEAPPFFGISQSHNDGAKLPQNFDAVEILDTNSRRELGVYARLDLPAGHRVIVDYPMISCIHWRQKKGRRNIAEEWSKLRPQARADLRDTFTRLHSLPLDKEPSASTRKKLEHFIEDYGFWDGRQTYAFIFKLGCHINHACLSCANAQHYVDAQEPNTMTVRLIRNVKEGEELYINYGKAKMPFGCAVCGGGITGRHTQDRTKDGWKIKDSFTKRFSSKTESTASTARSPSQEQLGGIHIHLPFRTLTRSSTSTRSSIGNRSTKRGGALIRQLIG